jgi:hypothetical protein
MGSTRVTTIISAPRERVYNSLPDPRLERPATLIE